MNGVITSLGLMIWVYVSMRALYQAEESKTWYGFLQAIVGVIFIDYYCYELILNSASLNDFKQISRDDTNLIALGLLVGTAVTVTVAARRAFKRLKGKPIAANGAEPRQESGATPVTQVAFCFKCGRQIRNTQGICVYCTDKELE